MKRIIIVLCCLISTISSAQIYQNRPEYGWLFKRIKIDSTLTIPQDTTIRSINTDQGAIVYNTGDSALYAWNGSWWVKQGRSGSSNGITLSQLNDSLTDSDLQRTTERGNATNINILANGGVDVSSGNLMLGRGAGTSRIIANRFLDLYGPSTGVTNGAFISYYKSNGIRIGADGDGSSWDDHMYHSVASNNDMRFTVSSGQASTDPYSIPLVLSGYATGAKVLIGDTAVPAQSRAEIKEIINGNQLIYNTGNNAPVTEYTDGNYPKLRVGNGMQGQPEWNAFANMYYYNRTHRYYDSTYNAIWLALSPIAGAFAVQYAPKGYNNTTGDIWSLSGNRILFKVDTVKTDFYVITGTFGFDIRRAKSANNQGLSIDVGGGATRFNSYDSTNVVFADYEFRSGKGSTAKTLGYVDGDTGNWGVGPSSSPLSTVDVQGSIGAAISTVTGNTTLDGTYHTVLVNNTGSVNITLPAAASFARRIYTIKKVSAALNDVVIIGTIDGVANKTLTLQYSGITLQSNGVSWFITGGHAAATTY